MFAHFSLNNLYYNTENILFGIIIIISIIIFDMEKSN